MKVAAVVVTYNRIDLLKECIDAIRRQTRPLDEIIVVNNGSTDGTTEWLNNQVDVTVILQDNQGSAGGQHTGINRAYEKGYDWIWCMDDDAYPQPDALGVLLSAYEQLDSPTDVAVLQSQVHNFVEEIPWGISRLRKNVLGFLLRGPSESVSLSDRAVKEVDLLPFVGFLMKASVIQDVGLPRRELYLTIDDWDYCVRIAQSGYRLLAVPDSIVKHKQHVSDLRKRKFSRQRRAQYYYHCVRNNLFFCFEHLSYLGSPLALAGVARQLFKGIALASVLVLKLDRQSRLVSRAIISGIVDGLRNRLGPTPTKFYGA